MSLGHQAGQGIAWTGAAKALSQVVGLVVTLWLARLLTPADFGLVAMIVVVTGFLGVFGEMGFATALVQRAELDERHRSSVFWLNVVSGVAIAGVLVVAAPWVAQFYREPRLSWLMRVLALDFVLAPLSMVQHAILSREMKFRALAIAETSGMLLSSALALGLALADYGVWALVARALAATLTGAAAMWVLSTWRPRLLFSRSALGDLWGFSANLMGYTVISYWARQVDDLLIGRVLGARSLGLYGRAYSTMMMPVTEVGGVLSRVMFPTFSKLQHDPAETKRMYLSIVAALAFLTFPVMLGLFVLSEPFILVLYGSQWVEAATVLRIYALVGASHSIGATVAWIYKSQGRTDWLLRWGLLAGSLTIVGIFVGIYLGSIESVAICYAVVTVGLLSYPRFAIPGRLIGMKPVEVLGAIRGALLCASAMAALMFGLGLLLPAELPAGANLAIRVLVGAIAYVACARAFRIRGLVELRRAIRSQLGLEQETEAPSAPDAAGDDSPGGAGPAERDADRPD